MRLVAKTALICLVSHVAHACHLSLPATVPAGRIAEISLLIKHASTRIADIQPGWSLSVDDDPSWATTVNGHASVGAAFLSKADFESMLVFSPEPGFSCETFAKARSTTVTLTFYVEDRFTRIRLGNDRISFTP